MLIGISPKLTAEETAAIAQAILTGDVYTDVCEGTDVPITFRIVRGVADGFIALDATSETIEKYTKNLGPVGNGPWWHIELAGTKFWYDEHASVGLDE